MATTLIAVDVVPVRFTTEGGLQFGTALRRFAPFAGRQALPGVLLGDAERTEDAAFRALQTKTDVSPSGVRHLAQLGFFDSPDRDLRERAVSLAYLAILDPAVAGGMSWGPAGHRAPFDHDEIIESSANHIRARLWNDWVLTRSLTGEVFTAATAIALETAAFDRAPDRGNLNRALAKHPGLERSPILQTDKRGHPATWYWSLAPMNDAQIR